MKEKIKEIVEEVMSVKLNDYTEVEQVNVDSLDLINIFFKSG